MQMERLEIIIGLIQDSDDFNQSIKASWMQTTCSIYDTANCAECIIKYLLKVLIDNVLKDLTRDNIYVVTQLSYIMI